MPDQTKIAPMSAAAPVETAILRKRTAAELAKIAGIETLIARVGLRNQLLVKITTEDGLVGWGESGLSGREKSVAATVEHYAGFLVGQDSRNIARIWQEAYRSQYFEGGRVLTAAISAIDIALYDLLGKRLEVPVYQLLGGKQRDVIPTFGTTMGKSIEQQLKDVTLLVDEGWICIRTYPGSFDDNDIFDPRATLAKTAEELIAIREKFGNSICLGVDMHHRYTIAEAADFCAMMPRGTLNFIEEPIRSETPEAYAMLRGMTDIPFAVGEEFASKWEAARFLDAGMTQYMRLDVSNIGGFTEAMKVAAMSERHYVDIMPHNPLGPVCTAASVHMSAAVPNFSWLETRQTAVEKLGYHDASLFPKQIEMKGPVYLLPEEPGLGIEVNEDALRSQTAEHVEGPHLKRPDGSVTNW
ncbi:mandelate racemase/muconate lactonizing enzyme family protein [Cognatishimia maritima]|uniref:Galactonate dehydratase n=1 Tax=Cognatishimia maritima TaxID=870908 RepID=A0A1M5QEZ8_9RHOB|nr:mandelate racemase/muconate lactonizing enzyme family protein [Cognatishimia maritima]SHH12755.1 galactonate dehydratase [Cognatishimia maritima]